MTTKSVQRALPPMEVNRVEKPHMLKAELVNKVENPLETLEAAKVFAGAAVKDAIGDDPLKVYGDKGYMSGVVSGRLVPDWFARIIRNPSARRRFAKALAKGDCKVRTYTVLEFEDEEKAG